MRRAAGLAGFCPQQLAVCGLKTSPGDWPFPWTGAAYAFKFLHADVATLTQGEQYVSTCDNTSLSRTGYGW
jgi:hypothetical protein